MQILLACAKTMHDEVRSELPLTTPRFEREAEAFARDMMQYDVESIADMLCCSKAIAAQNKLRYMRFFDNETPKLPAILAYYGQAYKHLQAETMDIEDMRFANDHLWITSFLYGLLRPLDGIRPYRMEGKVTLPSADSKSMFNFWQSRLTDVLIDSVKADDGILVHLATEEFQHLFDWRRVCNEVQVIQPQFYVSTGSGLKMQAVWAKTCRGAMTRFIIENRHVSPEQLLAFTYKGFTHAPHLGDTPHPTFVH